MPVFAALHSGRISKDCNRSMTNSHRLHLMTLATCLMKPICGASDGSHKFMVVNFADHRLELFSGYSTGIESTMPN